MVTRLIEIDVVFLMVLLQELTSFICSLAADSR
jgi:hypothetical protein